jgi:polyisoprenoid-binding protein YceI
MPSTSSKSSTAAGKTQALALSVAGKTAPLTTHQVKATVGTAEPRFFHCLGDARASRFGVKVKAMSDTIPATAELAGITVELTPGVKDDGRATAKFYGNITVDGETKSGKLTITDHGDGTWQVIASVFTAGSAKAKVNETLFA